MSETKPLMSVADMTAVFLEQVIEADIAMQLKQYETWRKASTKDPLRDMLSLQPAPGDTPSEDLRHVVSDLLEGIDRLNNLALAETRLEIELEEIRPPLFKRLWAAVQGRVLSRYFRLAPANHRSRRARIKLILTVQRKSQSGWQVKNETVPDGEIASGALVPVIK